PTLNGVDVRALSPLWGPFLLINAGCALRVVDQVLTDFTGSAYPVAGASGVLEVLGLALWGAHLWSVMAGRARTRPIGARVVRLAPGPAIEAGHVVGDVLDCYPALLDTFLAYGFRPLANPFFRRTVARHTTLDAACRTLGVELPQLLDALNRSRTQTGRASRTKSLSDKPRLAVGACEHPRGEDDARRFTLPIVAAS